MTARSALRSAAAASLLAVLCVHPAAGADAIRISGTGAGIGGMRTLAAAFAAKRPDLRVTVLASTGSTGGIRAVADGRLDLASSSRVLSDAEKKTGVVEEPYATTAIVFGTQAANPAAGFSLRQIEDIFAGRQGGWPNGSRIRLALRPASDAFTRYIVAYSPGMKAALDRAATVPGVFVGSTDQDAADYIERTPGSFGPTSLSLILSERRRIKALSVDGVVPTVQAVAEGRYRYTLPLSVVYRGGTLSAPVRDFLDFLFSPRAAAILRKNGHAPVARGAGAP